MEGEKFNTQIDNVEKAQVGASAEKPFRDLARQSPDISPERKDKLDEMAEHHGEETVNEFEKQELESGIKFKDPLFYESIDWGMFSNRTKNTLNKSGIYSLSTWGDLSQLTEKGILMSKGSGRKTVEEIKQILAKEGMTLGTKYNEDPEELYVQDMLNFFIGRARNSDLTEVMEKFIVAVKQGKYFKNVGNSKWKSPYDYLSAVLNKSLHFEETFREKGENDLADNYKERAKRMRRLIAFMETKGKKPSISYDDQDNDELETLSKETLSKPKETPTHLNSTGKSFDDSLNENDKKLLRRLGIGNEKDDPA